MRVVGEIVLHKSIGDHDLELVIAFAERKREEPHDLVPDAFLQDVGDAVSSRRGSDVLGAPKPEPRCLMDVTGGHEAQIAGRQQGEQPTAGSVRV